MRAPVSWLRELVEIPADQSGRDIAEHLVRAGLEVETEGHRFPGLHPDNICNRGATGRGVQLELSDRLRDADHLERVARATGWTLDRWSALAPFNGVASFTLAAAA